MASGLVSGRLFPGSHLAKRSHEAIHIATPVQIGHAQAKYGA